LHQKSRKLELAYASGETFSSLIANTLRVFTPSAEARRSWPGQETLQTGKRNVEIERIEPVGTYAVRLVFLRWSRQRPLLVGSTLQPWSSIHEELWQNYLAQIEAQGLSRDVDTTSRPAAGGSCGHHH
jgi:DUF971 family protein